MEDEPQKEHPHDGQDPRDFIMSVSIGEDRVEELKDLFSDFKKTGKFYVPNAHIGYGAGFADQSNHEYFKKHYPWLQSVNQGLGLDVDDIEHPYVSYSDRDKPQPPIPTIGQFLVDIPADDWEQFKEDVGYLQQNYSIDEDREQELRNEAETEYWEEGGFKDFLNEAKKKFNQDSFQQWALPYLEPWEAYELCSDAGFYMEEEQGGSVWMNEEKAVKALDWDDIETALADHNHRRQRPSLEAMRRAYEQAKLAWWNDTGGELFFAACQRRASDDPRFASGLGALPEDRLKSVYDRIVLDENIGNDKLPAYFVITEDVPAPPQPAPAAGQEAPPAPPPLIRPVSVVVGLGDEDATLAAAEEVALLGHEMIADFVSNMVPREHPELPFKGNLPRMESQPPKPKDWILKQPRNPMVRLKCPHCGGHRTVSQFLGALGNDVTQASLKMVCPECGEWFVTKDSAPKVLEAKPIPDPHNPRKATQADVHDWIVSGGPDVGELLWNTDRLYLIIGGDDDTIQKYFPDSRFSTYEKKLIGVPDPEGHFKTNERPFLLTEQPGKVDSGRFTNELGALLQDKFYGSELSQALMQRYKEMANRARREGDDEDFRNALLMLMQVGGHGALKGYYRHIRPGQISKFDIRYGMELLKKGRIAAAAKRFGVDRQQITKQGYLYAVGDWTDTTNFFYEGNHSDYRKSAEKVFNGEIYDWFDHLQGELSDAIDWLLPEHYKEIRELLTWAEVRNPDYEDGEGFFGVPEDTLILSPKVMAQLDDALLEDLLKQADEIDYDGRVEEIAEALKMAHVRAQETGYSDAYHKAYTDALESSLGASQFTTIGGKDKLVFLIPWKDMLERLDKANEDQGEFDGSLDDLVDNYSEPAQPGDDPSPDWSEVKKWYQEDTCGEALSEIKPLPPHAEPEPPGQAQLPLGESLLLEGYNWGCTMVYPASHQAQFILDWGRTNISDDVLFKPKGDDTMGRESEIHATVKYGLESTGVPEVLRALVERTPAFPVYIGSISLFQQEDHDVVKLDVESPWLRDLHQKITSAINCPGDKHPSYKPHVTLAYVQKGTCDHLVGQDLFDTEGSPGCEFVVNELEYTGPGEKDGERVREMLPLSKTDFSKPKQEESVEREYIMREYPVGFYVTLNIPGEKPLYFNNWGRLEAEPEGPVPLQMAHELVAYAQERYGASIDSYVKIIPVQNEAAPTIRNAVSIAG